MKCHTVMKVKVVNYRGRPVKTWWDDVKDDVKRFGLSQKDERPRVGRDQIKKTTTKIHLKNDEQCVCLCDG